LLPAAPKGFGRIASHLYPKSVESRVRATQLDYRMLRFLCDSECNYYVRLCRIPKLNSAVQHRTAIQCQPFLNDIIDAKITTDHVQIRRTNPQRNGRGIRAMRQYADVIAQQVKPIWLHDDCK
jgi:hypothetical protein